MKMNFYKVRKWGGIFINGFFPVFFFFVGILYLDLMVAIVLMFLGVLAGAMVSNRLTKHAFNEMMEGAGLLTLTLDSSGLIIPFITSYNKPPYIHGHLMGKETDGIYNRDLVYYLSDPKHAKHFSIEDEEGNLHTFLELPNEEEKTDHVFSFGAFPTFIFNKNIDSYLSKDSLSTFEKDVFTKQHALYILKKTEDLTHSVRDFARYIVEQTKPRGLGLFGNPWIKWIIIGGLVILLMILLGPTLMDVFTGTVSSSGGILPSGGPIS